MEKIDRTYDQPPEQLEYNMIYCKLPNKKPNEGRISNLVKKLKGIAFSSRAGVSEGDEQKIITYFFDVPCKEIGETLIKELSNIKACLIGGWEFGY